jgi:hypothetical protein
VDGILDLAVHQEQVLADFPVVAPQAAVVVQRLILPHMPLLDEDNKFMWLGKLLDIARIKRKKK